MITCVISEWHLASAVMKWEHFYINNVMTVIRWSGNLLNLPLVISCSFNVRLPLYVLLAAALTFIVTNVPCVNIIATHELLSTVSYYVCCRNLLTLCCQKRNERLPLLYTGIIRSAASDIFTCVKLSLHNRLYMTSCRRLLKNFQSLM